MMLGHLPPMLLEIGWVPKPAVDDGREEHNKDEGGCCWKPLGGLGGAAGVVGWEPWLVW